LEPGAAKISVVEHGLVFYWLGQVDNNLHYIIDQEFNPAFPHCYTTPPVKLTPQSVVLDVGACEGLFSFRVLKAGLAARVIAFEPSADNVRYTSLAAKENGVADRLTIEPVAVGKASGRVSLVGTNNQPDGYSIQAAAGTESGTSVVCVSLDEYCASHQLRLTSRDLIKIDAEGSDFDVLLGAERVIREGSPQIAVTTYHKESHASEIVDWLKRVQPAYRLRLKGFSSWTPLPTPVLLQAAL
jgi:FkbM family methyltransferase